MVSKNAVNSPSAPSFFAGRAAADAVYPAIGKSMWAMFASVYHAKTDYRPRKLTKRRPVRESTLSTFAPPPSQLGRVPTFPRADSSQLKATSQTKPIFEEPQRKLAVPSRSAVFEMDATPTRISSRRPANPPYRTSPPTGTQIQPPNQVRRELSDHPSARLSATTNTLPPLSARLKRPNLPTPVGARPMPSGSLRSPPPSPSVLAGEKWSWEAHPDPLHSDSPSATAAAPDPGTRTRGVHQIMGKNYTRKLSRMSVLPALAEVSDEAHTHTPESPARPVVPSITVSRAIVALHAPLCRPAPPVNLPDIQRSQSQQLRARNDLVEAANSLRAENTQLSSYLQDAVSRSIVATTQLEHQKRDNLALEESLKALWSLVQPNTGLDNISKTAQICEQVRLLSTAVSNFQGPNTNDAANSVAALEQKLAQQTTQLSLCKRNDVTSRQMAKALIHENKLMKTRLDKVEAERLHLQTSLHAAEVKLERVERSLYVYPSSAQEILGGASPL